MKLKQYLAGSLLALSVLAGACSNEEIIEQPATTPDENQAELVFNFSGLRLPGSAPASRAENIATQEETVVESLVIILAGVDSETTATPNGAGIVYEYRSDWGTTTPPDGTDPAHQKLDLVQNGNVLSGKLLVDEAVMLPVYVMKRALILVNGIKLDLRSLYKPGIEVYNTAKEISEQDFDALYLMTGGKIDSNTMTDIGVYMKYLWGPTDLTTNSLATPLPMTGVIESINFHGSTNVNVPLVREVSRFDLRNGDTKQLRIGSIRPLDAADGIRQSVTSVNTIGRVDMQDQLFTAGSIDADWADVAPEVAPAFYTFPSELNGLVQLMKFRVSAKKLNGNTNLWEDKTYTLELKDANGKAVSIDRNTRYVINIEEVTDGHLVGVIRVAEWEQGGEIDGDLNTNDYSRKVPTLSGMTDNAVDQITWTMEKDANGVPTGVPASLYFGAARGAQTITFTTPLEEKVQTGVDDQPKVLVDVFAEDGGAISWLSWSSADNIFRGLVDHTLTIPAGSTDFDRPLLIKVKNQYFPEKYVMFRATGLAAGSISIDIPGSNNGNGPLTPPVGFDSDDTGSDEFETGTVVVVTP